ncbi:MAG: RNA polymerase sigma factor [Bryobacterales bacterium]|nr:RNA polymerase sigma factor [Bryobacterales bacterium]
MTPEPEEPRSDSQLMTAAGCGDQDAFHELVARTHPAVFRLAVAIVRNLADAEDVTQETYLAAFRTAAGFRGESTALTWLLRICRRQAWRTVSRRRESVADVPSLESLAQAAGWGTEDPERCANRAEDRAQLQLALQSLSTEHREVLLLRDLQGLHGDQVAALLGLPLPAMKSRLHRARLSLAAALRQKGYHA